MRLLEKVKMPNKNINEIDQLETLIKTDSIKVISFDIFDTLLVRPVFSPTDVFYFLNNKAKLILRDAAVDFYNIRLHAENEAREELSKKNPSYGEITLSQIYDYIADKYKYDEKTKNSLKQAEIDVETNLLRIRKYTQNIYKLAIDSEKPVILTSDVYIEKKILESILEAKGILGYKKLYVSSDCKKRKDTGELYNEVIREENIEPSNLLHIGDNYHSDVICAINSGAVPFYIPSNRELFFSQNETHKEAWKDSNKFSPSEKILLGICINKVAEDIFENQNFTDMFSSKKMLGYYGLGPFIFALAHYMLNSEDIQNHYPNVNFASRDGYLPKVIYDLLRGNDSKYLESKYIYGGRQAYDISNYNGDVFKYLSSKSNHSSNYSLVNLFDALVEIGFLQKKYTHEWLNDLNFLKDKKNGFLKLKKIVSKHHKEIKRILDKRKELTEEYYTSTMALNNEGRAIVFDTGYSGSVSKGIGSFVNGKIDKLYLWQTENNVKSDDIHNTRSVVLCGYQDLNNNNPPVYLIIEELFSPLEKACIGFTKNVNSEIVPRFESGAPFTKEMVDSLNAIQSGAVLFTKDVIDILGPYIHDVEFQSIHKFLNPIYKSLKSITDYSVHLLDEIVFNDNFSRNEQVSLSEKVEERNTDYFHRTNFTRKDLITSSSNEDIPENNLNIGIHLHLYNVEQAPMYVSELKNAPYNFDLLISVVDDKYKKVAEKYFNQNVLPMSRQIIVKAFPNRGRDVAPWLVGFRNELEAYDVVCHVHTKKSGHFTWGNNWSEYLVDNLISPSAFKEIIKSFNRQNDLGVVFPPIYKSIYKFWVKNHYSHMGINGLMGVCKQLLNKIKIDKNLDRNSVFFSVGNMFWYRREALTPLYDLNLKYNDFPPEPIPVDGTIAHAVERLHSIVAEYKGYKTLTYINQEELINEYHKNVSVNVLDIDDYRDKLKNIFTDLLFMHLEQEKYFGAVLISFRIYRENFINEFVQKHTMRINEKVKAKVLKDGWNISIRDSLLNEINGSIKIKNYETAKEKLEIVLNHEPMHLNSIKLLLDISMKENNIFYAAELNNFLLAIAPDKDAIKNKKLLMDLTKSFLESSSDTINMHPKENSEKVDKKNDTESEFIISIILVTYNQYEYTKACIDSILKRTKTKYEIIVIDNASVDGTPNKILKDFPSVKLVRNDENKGFPVAVNQGITKSKGKNILLLNNDTIVTTNWLERMIEIAESDSSIGIVGPISNAVSGVQIDKEAKYNSIEEMHKYAFEIKAKNKNQILEFPRVAFLCTLIKKEVIENIGGLDERFSPGNFEDDDFCLRAQLAGYKTVVAKDVFIHHFGSKSFAADGIKKYEERLETNKKIFIEKWGADPEEIWLHGKKIKERNIIYPLNTDDFSKSIERLQIFIEEKEFQAALKKINSLLVNFDPQKAQQHNISKVSLLNLAGNIALMMNDPDSARNYFESALNEDKESSSACTGLAEIFIIEENYEAAKTMYEFAFKLDPDNKNVVNKLEEVNSLLGNIGGNEIEIEKQNNMIEDQILKSITIDSDNLVIEAYELFNKNKFNESLEKLFVAEKYFNGHLTNPTNVNFAAAFFNLKGFNYLGINDLETAKECFERALNLEPNSSEACAGLGEYFYMNNNNENAKIMFEFAVKNNPNNTFAAEELLKINSDLEADDASAFQDEDTEVRIKENLNQILNSVYELFQLKKCQEANDVLKNMEELFYSQVEIENDLVSSYENLKE